jgi:hypothetical protein
MWMRLQRAGDVYEVRSASGTIVATYRQRTSTFHKMPVRHGR